MSTTQLSLNVRLRDDASFDNFFNGSHQASIASLIELLVSGQGQCYLWGASDSGKSHLLQACGHYLTAQQQSFIYIPLQDFVQLDVAVLDGLQQYQAVAIDDMQLLQQTQYQHWLEPLFHLYNQLRDNGGMWLTAASCAPRQLNLALADLQSRLQWGQVFALSPLNDEEKVLCLMQRAKNRGLIVDADVATYIMTRLPRDMAALMQFLDAMDVASLQTKRRITIPFVRSLLEGEL